MPIIGLNKGDTRIVPEALQELVQLASGFGEQ